MHLLKKYLLKTFHLSVNKKMMIVYGLYMGYITYI